MKKYLICFLILLFASPVWGAFYHVCINGQGEGDTSGSSRENCMDGFDDLGTPSAGDTYYLYDDDGDYLNEQLTSAASGSTDTYITYMAYPGESPVINNTTGAYAIEITHDWIKLDGLQIEGGTAAGIKLQSANNIFMDNMVFDSCATGAADTCIRVPDGSTCDDVTIEDSTWDNWTGKSMYMHGDNWIVRRNTFQTTTGDGGPIEMRDAGNVECLDASDPYTCCTGFGTGSCDLKSHNFLITENTFNGLGSAAGSNAAILLDGDDKGSQCADADDPWNCCTAAGVGPCVNSTNSVYHQGTISYNLFVDSVSRTVDGFYGASFVYSNIFHNTTDGAADSGIPLEVNGPNNKVYNNTFEGCENICMMFNDDPIDPNVASEFKNNIVIDTDTPNHLIWISDLGGYEPTIDYNIYWMGTGGEVKYYYQGTDYNFTNWKSTIQADGCTGCDNNSSEANPLLTAIGSNDFTLQSSSPAISAGAQLDYPKLLPGSTWPSSVLTGPCGNGCDMGAYEYPIWGTP